MNTEPGIPRRSFLKNTSVIGAATILSDLPVHLASGEQGSVSRKTDTEIKQEPSKPLEQKLWFSQELIRMMSELQQAKATALAEFFAQFAEKRKNKEGMAFVQLEVEVNDFDNKLREWIQSLRQQVEQIMAGKKGEGGYELLRLPVVEVGVSPKDGVRFQDHRFDPDFLAKKPSRPQPFFNQPVKSWKDLEKLIASQQSTNPDQVIKAKLSIDQGVDFNDQKLVDQLNELLPHLFIEGGVQKQFGLLFKEGVVAFKSNLKVRVELNAFADGSFVLEIKTPEHQDLTPVSEGEELPLLEDLVISSEVPVWFSVVGNKNGLTKAFVQFGVAHKFVDGHGQANVKTDFSSRVQVPLEVGRSLLKWVEDLPA